MTKFFTLPNQTRQKGYTTFSKQELEQIISLYSVRVSKGEWKDYALDSTPNSAIFSIFKSSEEQPVYSVTKINGQGKRKSPKFVINAGNKILKQSNSLKDALQIFEE